MPTEEYWFRIISELEAHLSLNQIAQKVGTSDSSLVRYKAGMGEPRFSVGNKLIGLHRLLTVIYPANGMPPAL